MFKLPNSLDGDLLERIQHRSKNKKKKTRQNGWHWHRKDCLALKIMYIADDTVPRFFFVVFFGQSHLKNRLVQAKGSGEDASRKKFPQKRHKEPLALRIMCFTCSVDLS
jgi:hypothetical protein